MRAKLFITVLICLFITSFIRANDYYVSTSGSDDGTGTLGEPWRTIQHAADKALPGSVIHIGSGVYKERVVITKSGDSKSGYITYLGDSAGGTIIDGEEFTVDDMKGFRRSEFGPYGLDTASGLVEVIDASYIQLKNLQIRKYICQSSAVFPMGVMVVKTEDNDEEMSNVEMINLNISAIKNKSVSDGGAQGLAFYGGNPDAEISSVLIRGCEIHDCILGQSESLTLNGNISEFLIEYNKVHHNDNIGIDCIGWEGTAGEINNSSDPSEAGGHNPKDRVRNGFICNNLVYACSTEVPVKNPTYPKDDFSAGGIYIDGGKDIVIERNTIYHSDVGIEISSEHSGKDESGSDRNTEGIICRNNIVMYCGQYGIGLGGYDSKRGFAVNCDIVNNTVYKCSSLGWGGGQIFINKSHDNIISGNILVARDIEDTDDYDGFNNSGDDWEWDHGMVIGSGLNSDYNYSNILSANLYYTSSGSDHIRWKWEMKDSVDPKTGFDSLKQVDGEGIFGDPLFIKGTNSSHKGTENFAITDGDSPVIDKGNSSYVSKSGEYDFIGKLRVSDGVQDIGAYEVYPVGKAPSYPYPQSIDYPFGIKPSNMTQAEMNESVIQLYDAWKSNYLVNDFADWEGHTLWRVKSSVEFEGDTVSEAQGYGMIITALMAGYDPDAKKIFNGLYWFFKKYQNSHGLMKWVIKSNGNVGESDNATDGDMDIAMALLMADKQWGSDGSVNYLARGEDLMQSIMKWNVDSPEDNFGIEETNTWRLTLGDAWASGDGTDITDKLTRVSDFMTGHLKTFAEVSGNSDWLNVSGRCFTLIDKVGKDFSSKGLLPDFINDSDETPAPASSAETEYDGEYYYNACRLPWRLAADYIYSGEKSAYSALDRITDFIKSSTNMHPDSICDGYKLDGTPIGDDWGDNSASFAFLAPFGVGGMIDKKNQTWVNSTFEFMILKDPKQGYYEDSVRMICSLIMSGNYWTPNSVKSSSPQTEIAVYSAPVEAFPSGIADGSIEPLMAFGTDFGSVESTVSELVEIFQVSNLGTADLKIDGISFSGSGASYFRLKTPPDTVIKPGESSGFSIAFMPSSTVGEFESLVTILNNDSDENPYTFRIKARSLPSGEVYSLKYMAGANGEILGFSDQLVNGGSDGTPVAAKADSGYKFDTWSDGSTENPRVDRSVNDNLSVTASFILKGDVSVSYVNGNGPASGKEGSVIKISAVAPSADSVFKKWQTSSNGIFKDPLEKETDYTLPATDSTVEAIFETIFTLEYIAGSNGSLIGATDQKVKSGESGTSVTAVSDSGYHFIKWSDGITDNPRIDSGVSNNISVSAEFGQNAIYTLTVTGGSGSGNYEQQSVIDITANTPPVGEHFVKWESSSSSGEFDDFTAATAHYTMPGEDCSVDAVFSKDYILGYSVTSGGTLNGVAEQSVVSGGDGTPVEAVADTGYHFVKWSDNSVDNPRTETSVSGDLFVTAEFESNSLTLSPSIESIEENGGSIKLTLSSNVSQQSDLSVNLTGSADARLSVPASVVIPAGSTSVEFQVDAKDNSIADGDIEVGIDASVLDYEGSSSIVKVIDDEVPGYVVTPKAVTVSENSGSAGISVILTVEPEHKVIFKVSSSNTNAVAVYPGTLIFDSSNWNTEQSVIIMGINNSNNGDIDAVVKFEVEPLNSDQAFAGLLSQDVDVTVLDDEPVLHDDTAELSITESVVIDVLENDEYRPGESLTVTSITVPPAEGSAVISGSGKDITYTAGNSPGVYTFTYEATSSLGGSATAVVTVTVNQGNAVAPGSLYRIKASDVTKPSGEKLDSFKDFPKVTITYTDNIKNKTKSFKSRVMSEVPASGVESIQCEFKKSIYLYDKKQLKSANKGGVYTSDYLKLNPISRMACDIYMLFYMKEEDMDFDGKISRTLFLIPPTISSLEKPEGHPLGSGEAVTLNDEITLKGLCFGVKKPKIYLEYRDTVKNTVKRIKLKLNNTLSYPNAKGKENKSCMDVESGESKVKFYMPKKWWKNYVPGTYYIVIDNKTGVASVPVTTR